MYQLLIQPHLNGPGLSIRPYVLRLRLFSLSLSLSLSLFLFLSLSLSLSLSLCLRLNRYMCGSSTADTTQ